MHFLMFGGSGGGCGRTTSSLLCAAGMAGHGIRVLHKQVLLDGRSGVQISGLAPFLSTVVPATPSNLADAIWTRSEPAPFDVAVIDLPKIALGASVRHDLKQTYFIPTRPSQADVARSESDWHQLNDVWHYNGSPNRRPPRAYIVPVGWREDQRARLSVLALSDVRRPGGATLSVLQPGIPELDPLDLHLWVGGGEFDLTSWESSAALQLGEAAWRCATMQI